MKKCSLCKEEKQENEFSFSKTSKDALQGYCKSCSKKKDEVYRKEKSSEKEKYRENRKEIKKNYDNVYKNKHRDENDYIIRMLLNRTKCKCKKNNIFFEITKKDIQIPQFCPILGIPLFIGKGKICDNSISIDRILPDSGYIKGNVVIMSARANMIKNCGTWEEHLKIANFIKNFLETKTF